MVCSNKPIGQVVAVYLATSYQLDGFTVQVPLSRITPLDVPADQAMRAVLTGGSIGAASGGHENRGQDN